MHVGVPKEVKVAERRVGLTPASVRELVAHGHEVTVEAGAGIGIATVDTDAPNAAAPKVTSEAATPDAVRHRGATTPIAASSNADPTLAAAALAPAEEAPAEDNEWLAAHLALKRSASSSGALPTRGGAGGKRGSKHGGKKGHGSRGGSVSNKGGKGAAANGSPTVSVGAA